MAGDTTVPVADCTTRQLSSHSKREMKFSDYIEYWRSCNSSASVPSEGEGLPPPEHKLLYTKDWHFVRSVKTLYIATCIVVLYL